MKKCFLGLLAPLIFLSTVSALQESSQNKNGSILIRKDRPSVYIEFQRSGKAPPLFEGEKEERIWLRLYNNTRWAIAFCSFSVKDAYGAIGVVHKVKEYPTSIGGDEGEVRGRRGSERRSLPKDINQNESTKTPKGYSTWDTCTPYSLDSGKSVAFSIPREHLGKDLYIEIEFWPEWENRDNELGDFPQSYVSFGSLQLPSKER